MPPRISVTPESADQNQALKKNDGSGKDVHIKRNAIHTVKEESATDEKVRLKVGRKIIAVVRENRHADFADQNHKNPLRNEQEAILMIQWF